METHDGQGVNAVRCQICGTEFIPRRGGQRAQRYCREACRREANRQRKQQEADALRMYRAQAANRGNRRHAGQLVGEGMTAVVCRYMMQAALERAWVTPHDVIQATGCCNPTTFFSDINARLSGGYRIVKRWAPEKGRRGCWQYQVRKVE